MATSKELEARKRNGRKQAAKQKRATRNSPNQKRAGQLRRKARRRRTAEDRDRDQRIKKYQEGRRDRWEAEMLAITRPAMPNFNPLQEAGSFYRARRIQQMPGAKR